MNSSQNLKTILQSDKTPSIKQQLFLVCQLSIPAILAQITSIVMQYIDAAMVGKLGAEASAAIGVIATSTWLIYGLGSALASGFSVQVAQAIGAGNEERARQTVRESLITVGILSILIALIAFSISFNLPIWLGAEEKLQKDASVYFCIFAVSQPVVMLTTLGLGLLECSGNIKLPSFLSALMCILDIAFNAIFIFGLGLGVSGAALGTAMSELFICLVVWAIILFYSPQLKLHKGGSWNVTPSCIKIAARISLPMAFEQFILGSAQVLSTRIIAPLGTVALAANSFGVTAEALCYMPAYGISTAATTLTGQSVGAKKTLIARKFAWLSVLLGMIVMAFSAVLMYIASPLVFNFFTPDLAVQELGIKVLRIEVLAEPLFAASIIASGAMRGAGNTIVPGIINLGSMWGVRLTLSFILAQKYGLQGVWSAMCIELCFRGILYIIGLALQKWKSI